MAEHTSIKVTFLRTTWVGKLDDDGLAWGIYKCEDESQNEVAIKGKLDPAMARFGMVFEVTGKWENDKKYGRQFTFNNYSRCQPNGEWGTVAFLTQADGIGETIAKRIYAAFGEESIITLIEQPSLVCSRTPGLRAEVADEASCKLAPLLNESKDKLPLLDLFKGTKLPAKTASRVVEARIPDAVNALKANPFILMERFKGIAFKQCDSLRIKLKLPPDMPERIVASCQQVFSDVNDQTWLTMKQIHKGMTDVLESDSANVMLGIMELTKRGVIVKNQVGEGVWFALKSEAQDEWSVAAALYQRMRMPAPNWPIEAIMNDEYLTDHQKEVVVNNMKNGGRLIILPGSPGTGKTFTLGRIIHHFGGLTAACAPTGKAAQRLTQSLGGTTATTIHRLLEPRPLTNGGFVFTAQAGEVQVDLLAVDESSMVNNWLAASMFRGVSPDAYIILVGDQNQLPPVGPGTMLRDLQRMGNQRELTEIMRNEGMIVQACASIRDGEEPELHITGRPGENVEKDTNVHLCIASKDDSKMRKVAQFVDKVLTGAIDVDDPLQDIQFMTATHKNPNVGREVLNKFLQSQFNKEMKGDHQKFKVGDKVICIENCFLGEDKTFVANGEIGIVVESWEKKISVRLTDGNVVLAPCGKDGNGWDLGYCITTHKFQGSECKYVVTVMGSDYGSNLVISREWFYTALSRAKHCSVVYASPGQITAALKRCTLDDRKSFILEIMRSWENGDQGEEEEDVEAHLEDCDRHPGADAVYF